MKTNENLWQKLKETYETLGNTYDKLMETDEN